MNPYAVVLAIITVTLLGVSLGRLNKTKTKADYLVAGRSLPASSSSSLCSPPGSAPARFSAARRTPTNTASPPSGNLPADGPDFCSSTSSLPAPASSRSSPSPTCSKPATTSRARPRRHRHPLHLHRHHQLPVHRRRRHPPPHLPRHHHRHLGKYIIAAFVIVFTAIAGMSSVAYMDVVIGLLATVTISSRCPSSSIWQEASLASCRASRHALPVSSATSPSRRRSSSSSPPACSCSATNPCTRSSSPPNPRRTPAAPSSAGSSAPSSSRPLSSPSPSPAPPSSHRRSQRPSPRDPRLHRHPRAPHLARRLPRRCHLRQDHLHRQQLSLLPRHQPRQRRLRPLHRSPKPPTATSSSSAASWSSCSASGRCYQSLHTRVRPEKALYAYTIYSAALTPVILAAFFWKRTTATAAVIEHRRRNLGHRHLGLSLHPHPCPRHSRRPRRHLSCPADLTFQPHRRQSHNSASLGGPACTFRRGLRFTRG
jgi:SSS family solute:Na+ symporter